MTQGLSVSSSVFADSLDHCYDARLGTNELTVPNLSKTTVESASFRLDGISARVCACNSTLPELLASRRAIAIGRLTADADAFITNAAQSVPPFVFNIRRQASVTDKVLEAQIDEFDDSIAFLELCVQQSLAECGVKHLDDSSYAVNRMLVTCDTLPAIAGLLAPALSGGEVIASLETSFAQGVSWGKVTHEPWFARGKRNRVTIGVIMIDAFGSPACVLKDSDVVWWFDDDAVGWNVESVLILENVVWLIVFLEPDCKHDAHLSIRISDSERSVYLKVSSCYYCTFVIRR